MASNNNTAYAATYIRTILHSDSIATGAPTQAGRYQELLTALYNAHQKNGPEGARNAWQVLAPDFPEIAEYVDHYRKKLYHISELDQLPRRETLYGIIGKRELVGLYGPSGVGKSFLALRIALGLAQTATVIYVAAEGVSGYKQRIEAFFAHFTSTDKEAAQFHLHIAPINMLVTDQVDAFIADIKLMGLDPDLIVLDTLARCMVGGDENSARDMGEYVESVDRIRKELDTTVISIHHTGKKGGSERGSSALRAGFDLMISLTEKDGMIKIDFTKVKDGAESKPRYSRLKEVMIDTGQTSCVAVNADPSQNANTGDINANQFDILEILAMSLHKESGITIKEIMESAGHSRSTVNRHLNTLFDRGYIKKRGTRNALFSITEAGTAKLAARDDDARTDDDDDPLSIICDDNQ